MAKSDVLEVSFSVSDSTAEQIAVRLTHDSHPFTKTFVASGPTHGVFVYKLVRVS